MVKVGSLSFIMNEGISDGLNQMHQQAQDFARAKVIKTKGPLIDLSGGPTLGDAYNSAKNAVNTHWMSKSGQQQIAQQNARHNAGGI